MQCGLDKGPRAPEMDWQVQVEAFEAQLRLAQELCRPVSVSTAQCPVVVCMPRISRALHPMLLRPTALPCSR